MRKISLNGAATVLLLIFSVLLTPQAFATPEGSTGVETYGFGSISPPVAVAIGATLFGRWITPIDEWEAEIRQLTEDEKFVQRWMLLNDSPADLEKGQRALTVIQKKKKALEKRLTRLKRWAYPLIIAGGTGAMMLAFFFTGD